MNVPDKQMTLPELDAGMGHILLSPKDNGLLKMIVRRPAIGEREVLNEGGLDIQQGLVGDNWLERKSSRSPDGSAHPEMQITIMNSRVIDLITQDKNRWPLAGDQLFIDMDLSAVNLPTGTRLALGSAILIVTKEPHTGCKKFSTRFGLDALRWLSSPLGKKLNLRGIYAKIVKGGKIQAGDTLSKLSS